MSVDGFGCRRGPEKPGHLGVAFLVGLGRESQVPPVSLGLTGKGFHKIFGCPIHACFSLTLLELHGHAATNKLAATGFHDLNFVPANFAQINLSCFRRHGKLVLLG